MRLEVKAHDFSEYQTYVHNFFNSGPLGNWTYVEKPFFPVLLKDSQLSIGKNWSIVCPLEANHSYHAYFYGKWISNALFNKTDYDVYVYDPYGKLVGYHTSSAGLPQHLGSTPDEPFFIPKYTGNYTFIIDNSARESAGSAQATFMIIEDVECNAWHQQYVEGTNNASLPVFYTSWAYEFVTDSQHVEIWIRVPDTLDMYEARLYMMTCPTAANYTVLDGIPLAWEPGLYGNRSDNLGGYNTDSRGYEGQAYASCEYYGQDMLISFNSTLGKSVSNPGKSLYHLVFIGEVGSGTVDFLIKTEFNNTSLVPTTIPDRVYPGNNATVAYTSNSTDLINATLEYSTDHWKSVNSTDMKILNRTCTSIIPAQAAGAFVEYNVTARDTLENVLTANGSYLVKYPSALTLAQNSIKARPSENVTIKGFLTPKLASVPIAISIASTNESKNIICYTLDDGTFSTNFKPETVGTWIVSARFNGSATLYGSDASPATVIVEEPMLVKYSLYIFGGIGAIAMVIVIVYVRKQRL